MIQCSYCGLLESTYQTLFCLISWIVRLYCWINLLNFLDLKYFSWKKLYWTYWVWQMDGGWSDIFVLVGHRHRLGQFLVVTPSTDSLWSNPGWREFESGREGRFTSFFYLMCLMSMSNIILLLSVDLREADFWHVPWRNSLDSFVENGWGVGIFWWYLSNEAKNSFHTKVQL